MLAGRRRAGQARSLARGLTPADPHGLTSLRRVAFESRVICSDGPVGGRQVRTLQALANLRRSPWDAGGQRSRSPIFGLPGWDEDAADIDMLNFPGLLLGVDTQTPFESYR